MGVSSAARSIVRTTSRGKEFSACLSSNIMHMRRLGCARLIPRKAPGPPARKSPASAVDLVACDGLHDAANNREISPFLGVGEGSGVDEVRPRRREEHLASLRAEKREERR